MKKQLSSICRQKKIQDTLFTFHKTPHITLGNEQCLKLLLGVCNTKRRGDLSLSLEGTVQIQKTLFIRYLSIIEYCNLLF
jgi:hypothetical protein